MIEVGMLPHIITRAPQPLTTAFRNALAVDGAALVDLDGTFQKTQRGGT
jgi:hypothetical protein